MLFLDLLTGSASSLKFLLQKFAEFHIRWSGLNWSNLRKVGRLNTIQKVVAIESRACVQVISLFSTVILWHNFLTHAVRMMCYHMAQNAVWSLVVVPLHRSLLVLVVVPLCRGQPQHQLQNLVIGFLATHKKYAQPIVTMVEHAMWLWLQVTDIHAAGTDH